MVNNNTYCLARTSKSDSAGEGEGGGGCKIDWNSRGINAQLVYDRYGADRIPFAAPSFTPARIGDARTKKSKTANNNEHRNPSCKRDRRRETFLTAWHTVERGSFRERSENSARCTPVVQLVNAIHFALFRAAKTCLSTSPPGVAGRQTRRNWSS